MNRCSGSAPGEQSRAEEAHPGGARARRAPSLTHLVVVALGKEQGTELPVERCLVGLLPVLGQLVHVGLGQLEGLLSQVVLAVPIPNVQQPWGMQRELLRELQKPLPAAAPGSSWGTLRAGALPAQNCPAGVRAGIFPAGDVTGFYLLTQFCTEPLWCGASVCYFP